MARDQEGSRLLQKWISQNNQKIINEIFSNVIKINFWKEIFTQIKNDFFELMIDPFGNYFCQKIMELISQDDLNYVVNKISDKIVKISYNQHGTRSVQKLIELVKNEKIIAMIRSYLQTDLINLSKVT